MNYEYKKELPEHGIISTEKLNELGAGGWDNYAVYGGVFYFKKEVAEKRAFISSPPNQPEPKTQDNKRKK